MGSDFSKYVEDINFKSQYKSLVKKLKNKRILVYGAGSFFQYIYKNYDLSALNVVAISDLKFGEQDEGKDFLGYKIVPFSKIKSQKIDVILLAMQHCKKVWLDFEANSFNETDFKILPLAKQNKNFNFKNFCNLVTLLHRVNWAEILKNKRKLPTLLKELNYLSKIKIMELVKSNSKKVLSRLRKKVKKEKIKVCFTLHQASKWKCETIYQLMIESEYFEPYIIVTIPNTENLDYPSMQKQHFDETVKFFKDRGYRVIEGYDWNSKKYIHFKKFKPDIIIYQQPWNVEETQEPAAMSKYALTCYVPYFIANAGNEIEYGLDFHLQLYRHYILNNEIYNFYSSKMLNKGSNLKIAGHPQLDYFFLNREEIDKAQKKHVIYAPHWSINVPVENYSTFLWNGKYILEFAKSHPEISWVFKPHPILKYRLKNQGIMSENEIEEYWNEWAKIATVYETGDYMDFFKNAYAMITDCGSFLTEFLLTKQPVIHLVSSSAIPYNPSAEKIVKTYYQAHNVDELENFLKTVIIDKDDYLKEKRLSLLKEMELDNCYAAKNIVDDIKKELGL